MDISSLYLKAFYQLAQDRNFTKAANHLAITQSAFSHRIMNLERDLETTLFIREKSNIQLTDTGNKLLRFCEKVYKLQEEVLDTLVQTHSNELTGTVRVGGFSSILRSCVIPALAELAQANPKLHISTQATELSELMQLLKNSKVDFVISNKEQQSNAIESIFLGHEINVLAESKIHQFNGNYIDHDSKEVTTSSYFKLKPELDKNVLKHYFDDVYGLIDGVKQGFGRAILPRHLIENESEIKILYPKTQLKVSMFLHYYKNSYQTKVEKEVISAIKYFFKDKFK